MSCTWEKNDIHGQSFVGAAKYISCNLPSQYWGIEKDTDMQLLYGCLVVTYWPKSKVLTTNHTL